jgi:hypothetical protein
MSAPYNEADLRGLARWGGRIMPLSEGALLTHAACCSDTLPMLPVLWGSTAGAQTGVKPPSACFTLEPARGGLGRHPPLVGGRGEAAAVGRVHQEAVELLGAAPRGPRLLQRLHVDVRHEHAQPRRVQRRRHVVRHPRPPPPTCGRGGVLILTISSHRWNVQGI